MDDIPVQVGSTWIELKSPYFDDTDRPCEYMRHYTVTSNDPAGVMTMEVRKPFYSVTFCLIGYLNLV
jgi:hypothetical protein